MQDRPRVALQHGEYVGLVLCNIVAPSDPELSVDASDAGVMPGCDRIKAKPLCSRKERVKFQVAVALHTGVRSPSASVLVRVDVDDVAVELLGEVEHVVLNPQVITDSARIGDILERAASRIAGTTPELHRRTDDLVTCLQLERGSYGGIDPT